MTTDNGTTQYLIDPHGDALPRVLIREKPDTSTTTYVYGIGLLYEVDDATSTATYYHYDHIGNTVALSNGSGTLTDRMDYSPYGQVTHRAGTTDTPFLYVGQLGVQTDPNGLLHMRARYYSPELKRFVNADPIGFAGGMNWYAYANGSPVMYVDPSGLDAIIDIGYTRAALYDLHGEYHTFTMITDTVTGQKMITRAGPNMVYLKAVTEPYASHPRDNPSTTVHIQPVGVIHADFNDVVAAARSFEQVTNQNTITYSPMGGGVVGYNSNSYTGTFIQSLGFDRPSPNLPSMGFSSGRASPDLSYNPFPNTSYNNSQKNLFTGGSTSGNGRK